METGRATAAEQARARADLALYKQNVDDLGRVIDKASARDLPALNDLRSKYLDAATTLSSAFKKQADGSWHVAPGPASAG